MSDYVCIYVESSKDFYKFLNNLRIKVHFKDKNSIFNTFLNGFSSIAKKA